ncbi:GntR family transcriptional regulator [Arthrobacter rhombi]|uniref:GntR family transcriptional regulator n=1 Tax=Arthrobacter rhombi TaxID=71253 RepID=UPI0031E3CAD8
MSEAGPGQPLAAQVYEAVSDDIVAGRLAPGTPLGQVQLAARFDVSRTPVRDALTQLTTDGLVRLVPAKGYFVNDLSRNDVSDVFAVRFALESLAFREAFGHHTPRQLHHLKMLASETLLASSDDGTEVFDISLQYHRALMEPCGNPYLLEVLSDVWSHPIQRRITLTYRPGPEHIQRIAGDHAAIVRHLEEGNLEAGLKVLQDCHNPDDHRGAPLAI